MNKEIIEQLVKIANKLDVEGEYDIADKLTRLCSGDYFANWISIVPGSSGELGKDLLKINSLEEIEPILKHNFKYMYEFSKSNNSPYTQQMLQSELNHAINTIKREGAETPQRSKAIIDYLQTKINPQSLLPTATGIGAALAAPVATGATATGLAGLGAATIGAELAGIGTSAYKGYQAGQRQKALTTQGTAGQYNVDAKVMRQLNNAATTYKSNPQQAEALAQAALATKGQSKAGQQANSTYWNQIRYQQKQKSGKLNPYDKAKGWVNETFYGQPE
jgi:hypothetical protein